VSPLLLLASVSTASTGLPPGIVPPVRCGTPAFADLEMPELVPEPLPVPRPPSSDKLERDAYDVTDNELITENFAFRWGTRGGVTTAEVEDLAEAFEDAWLEEIHIQGHPVPTGADDYLFNVYIGDSGGGTPSGYGAAGYFTSDSRGWPMVVVAAGTLDDRDYADITAAHEFYHAIQGGTDRYPYSGDSAWFWEASATWASATVYPSNIYYASFMFGYAFLPHYPVNYFNYADSWNVEDYYQYGAFIVPLHLSEITADRDLIREVWTDSGPESDPLSMLQSLLDDRGMSFDDAFLDHAARMATFDYPEGDGYEMMANYYASSFSESDNMVADEVGPEGTDGFTAGPRSLRPYRYGYNAIEVDIGDAESIEVVIDGDEEGSRGSNATWGAKLVVVDRRDRTYVDFDWDDTTGTVSVDGLDGETVWIVVAPWTRQTRYFDSETFEYRYSVAFGEDDPVEPGDTGDTGEPVEDTGEPVEDTDEPVASDDDTATDDTEPVDGGSGPGKATTCSTVSAAGAWTVVLGMLGAAGRRREMR